MPNAVMVAKGLSIGAKLVYGLLLMFAWQDDECFPGQERLAAAASISVRQVQRYLVELKEFGLITWRCRGQNQTNIYFIIDIKTVERLKKSDATNMSCPDATPMSYKEDSVDNNVVEQLVGDKNKPATPDSEDKFHSAVEFEQSPDVPNNNITELQQIAKNACGIQIPAELLEELVNEYGGEKVKEKIKMLGSVQTRNAPGFLVAALRDDYILRPGRPQQQKRASPVGQIGRRKIQTRGPDDPEAKQKKDLVRSLYLS